MSRQSAPPLGAPSQASAPAGPSGPVAGAGHLSPAASSEHGGQRDPQPRGNDMEEALRLSRESAEQRRREQQQLIAQTDEWLRPKGLRSIPYDAQLADGPCLFSSWIQLTRPYQGLPPLSLQQLRGQASTLRTLYCRALQLMGPPSSISDLEQMELDEPFRPIEQKWSAYSEFMRRESTFAGIFDVRLLCWLTGYTVALYFPGPNARAPESTWQCTPAQAAQWASDKHLHGVEMPYFRNMRPRGDAVPVLNMAFFQRHFWGLIAGDARQWWEIAGRPVAPPAGAARPAGPAPQLERPVFFAAAEQALPPGAVRVTELSPGERIAVELAQHPILVRDIPRDLIPTWRRLFITAAMRCKQAGTATQRNAALLDLMALPGRALRSRRGGGGRGRRNRGRSAHRSLAAQIRAVESALVTGETDHGGDAGGAEAMAEAEDQRTPEEANADRAMAALAAGHLNKATAALRATPRVDCTSTDVLQELARLHPPPAPGDEPHRLPMPPHDAIVAPVTMGDEQTRRDIRRSLRRMGAPGPTGMSARFLLPLVDDDVAYAYLCELLSDIITGALPSDASDVLLASRLIPIAKAGPGLRPIACGEVLLRLACLILLSRCKAIIAARLAPVQLAIGVEGGSQLAFHMLWNALHSDRDLAAITLDLRNAYNTISRRRILEALYAHEELEGLWKFSRWLLGSPSLLLVAQDGVAVTAFRSATGVRQGELLGPVFFALALHPDVLAAIAHARQQAAAVGVAPSLINAVCILDNVNVVAPPSLAALVADAVREHIGRRGDLQFNTAEETVIYLHCEGLFPAQLQEHARRHGAKMVPSAQWPTAKVLGLPIGINAEAMQGALVTRLKHKYDDVFAALRDPVRLPLQAVMAILRDCCMGFLSYALRCLPPSLTRSAAQYVDEQVSEILRCRFRLPALPPADALPTPENRIARNAWRQVRWRLSMGGLGLPSMAMIAPAAYYAAMAQAAAMARQWHLQTAVERGLQEVWLAPSWSQLLEAAVAKETRGVPSERLHAPPTADQFFAMVCVPNIEVLSPMHQHLQASIVSAHMMRDKEAFMRDLRDGVRTAGEPHRAFTLRRMQEITDGTTPAAWLRALPTCPELSLPDYVFQLAITSWLGLVPPTLPPACVCGCSFLDAGITHLAECAELQRLCQVREEALPTSSTWTYRHNRLRDWFADLFRRAGFDVRTEVVVGQLRGNELRVDHYLHDAVGTAIMTDVTVAGAGVDVRQAPGALPCPVSMVLARREQDKVRKYQACANDHGALFFPLAATSMGAIGAPFRAILQFKSTTSDEEDGHGNAAGHGQLRAYRPHLVPDESRLHAEFGDRSSFIHLATLQLSCLIQRLSALCTLSLLARLRSHLRLAAAAR